MWYLVNIGVDCRAVMERERAGGRGRSHVASTRFTIIENGFFSSFTWKCGAAQAYHHRMTLCFIRRQYVSVDDAMPSAWKSEDRRERWVEVNFPCFAFAWRKCDAIDFIIEMCSFMKSVIYGALSLNGWKTPSIRLLNRRCLASLSCCALIQFDCCYYTHHDDDKNIF